MIVVLRVPGDTFADALADIKQCAQRFPGPHRIRLDVETRRGTRTVTLGPGWSVDGSAACLTALGEFGEPSHAPMGWQP